MTLALRAIFRVQRIIRHDKSVIDRKNKLVKSAFRKAGAYVRRTAQQSIRTSKYPSPPGRPPNTRASKFLKRFIMYAYDETKQQVVVGPVVLSLHRGKRIPRIVEYGGTMARRYDSGKVVVQTYKPRPFMKPALAKNMGKIAQMFNQKAVQGAGII